MNIFNINPLQLILAIPGIMIAMTVHSFAQAYVADKLGDNTPRSQGKITLNPIAHIDPIGFLMILILHFGWGKPIETHPKTIKDDLKVACSGTIANFLTAAVFAFILSFVYYIASNNGNPSSVFNTNSANIYFMVYYTVQINCVFGIINLFPLPGFDGFRILRDLAPKFFNRISYTLYRYQMIILLLFIFPIYGNYSVASLIIDAPSGFLISMLIKLFKPIFNH